MTETLDFSLLPQNRVQLANLCGENDCNISLIAQRLGIEVYNRGYDFRLVGEPAMIESGRNILASLYEQASKVLKTEAVHLQLIEKSPKKTAQTHLEAMGIQQNGQDDGQAQVLTDTVAGHGNTGMKEETDAYLLIRTPKKTIRTRGDAQRRFVAQIRERNIAFGVGPAGTGKTYLAVATAIEMLTAHQYERLIITRPAVEAGEKLGFLPGDFSQKVDPYLRPVLDALYECLGFELADSLIGKGIIEIAPLAFMRGRSFNHAFILLDEGQNTTVEQMKMFLTRMGFGSQVVVTGDPSQVDLPKHMTNGLGHALSILKSVPLVRTTRFRASDIVRHPLVQAIVHAYAQDEQTTKRHNQEKDV